MVDSTELLQSALECLWYIYFHRSKFIFPLLSCNTIILTLLSIYLCVYISTLEDDSVRKS
jgi:hypothetical protein